MRYLSSRFIHFLDKYKDENAQRPYVSESSHDMLALENARRIEAQMTQRMRG